MPSAISSTASPALTSGRHVHAGGQDRDMRGRAAAPPCEARDGARRAPAPTARAHRAIRIVSGGSVRTVRSRCLAVERGQHLALEVEQIADALAHARVVDRLERRSRIAAHGLPPGERRALAVLRSPDARSRISSGSSSSARCADRISRRWRSPPAADSSSRSTHGGQRARRAPPSRARRRAPFSRTTISAARRCSALPSARPGAPQTPRMRVRRQVLVARDRGHAARAARSSGASPMP